MTKKYKPFTTVIMSSQLKVSSHLKLPYFQCKLLTGAWISFMNNHLTMHLLRYQMNAIGVPSDHLTLEEILDLCVKAHIPLDFECYVYERDTDSVSCGWSMSVRLAKVPDNG